MGRHLLTKSITSPVVHLARLTSRGDHVGLWDPKQTYRTSNIVVAAKPANETKLPLGPLLRRDFDDFQQLLPLASRASFLSA